MKKGNYICNYCFIADAHDIKPDPENSKCSGLSKEDAEAGKCCDYMARKIVKMKDERPKVGYVDCAGCWDGWDLKPGQKCQSCGRVGWKK